MKTNQELLDFYKVELKKKYKIIKSRKCPEHFVKKMFIVKEKLNTKDLYLEIIDKCKCGSIEMLSWFDYEEVKEPLTDKERSYLGAVIKPFRDMKIGDLVELTFLSDFPSDGQNHHLYRIVETDRGLVLQEEECEETKQK